MKSNFIKFAVLQPQFTQYNHSKVIHILPWDTNSGVSFLGQSFSLKETAKNYCVAQCSTYTLSQNDNFIRITFVGRLLSGGWQYSHASKSNTVTAKEDVTQKFSCCNVI